MSVTWPFTYHHLPNHACSSNSIINSRLQACHHWGAVNYPFTAPWLPLMYLAYASLQYTYSTKRNSSKQSVTGVYCLRSLHLVDTRLFGGWCGETLTPLFCQWKLFFQPVRSCFVSTSAFIGTRSLEHPPSNPYRQPPTGEMFRFLDNYKEKQMDVSKHQWLNDVETLQSSPSWEHYHIFALILLLCSLWDAQSLVNVWVCRLYAVCWS